MRAAATNPPALAGSSHFVHFYQDEAFPADKIAAFIGAGLQEDLAGVVIATRAHREAVAGALERRGIDVRAARTQGRLVELDAAAMLLLFMNEDGPDGPRFHEAMSAILARAGRARRAYGSSATWSRCCARRDSPITPSAWKSCGTSWAAASASLSSAPTR